MPGEDAQGRPLQDGLAKTDDINLARDQAYEHDADVRFRLKHDVPVFNRPCRDVAAEYLAVQDSRAKRGEISVARPKKLKAIIEGALDAYVGSTQVHLIGDELWGGYPAWRRENGAGRNKRNGVREVSAAVAGQLAARDALARTKALRSRGIRQRTGATAQPAASLAGTSVAFISDSTIRLEMSVFGAIMGHAIKKRYVPASQRFEERPKLKVMRRDEFTAEEYRTLHTKGRAWVKEANKPSSLWYRTVAYNLILIACNTGMRPSELKNLRWRDITQATGVPIKSLYKHLIESVLIHAELREGAHGVPRSTYCFRHTYATFRLSESVDVYFLAEQMGTSVKMIEDHYGHVNTIKHADRVLRGMGGWDPIVEVADTGEQDAKASRAAATRQAARPRRSTKH